MKFLIYVEPTSLLPKNEVFQEILKLGRFDRAIKSPYVNQEQLTRDLLIEPWAHGETDKYMLSKQDFLESQIMAQGGAGGEIRGNRGGATGMEMPSSRSLAGMLERTAL